MDQVTTSEREMDDASNVEGEPDDGAADGRESVPVGLVSSADEERARDSEGEGDLSYDARIGYFPEAQRLDRRLYISNQKIKTILDAPLKYFAKYGEGFESKVTKAMKDGSNNHEHVLRPHEFEKKCVESPFKDFKTKAAREWRDALPFNAMIVTKKERENLNRIRDAVWAHPLAKSLLTDARMEYHGYAKDPESGYTLYSRPDFITHDGIIGELKFVECSEYERFRNQQYFEDWYIQGGFYNLVDGLIRGEHRPQNFFYIAVEKTYPHIVQVYPLGAQYEVMAERKIRKGISLIKEHMEIDPMIANKSLWRGYDTMARELTPKYGHMAGDPDFLDLIEIGGQY